MAHSTSVEAAEAEGAPRRLLRLLMEEAVAAAEEPLRRVLAPVVGAAAAVLQLRLLPALEVVAAAAEQVTTAWQMTRRSISAVLAAAGAFVHLHSFDLVLAAAPSSP